MQKKGSRLLFKGEAVILHCFKQVACNSLKNFDFVLIIELRFYPSLPKG
jgi:hypothetical protein